MARTSANIKKRHYRVLHRNPAAFGSGNYDTLANWTTFLATFTELGFCRDKTINPRFEEADREVLDEGTIKRMDYNGIVEFVLLQTQVADYTAYEAIENVAQDILLVDETNLVFIFFPNALCWFGENVVSGETESVPAKFEKEGITSKSDFRTRGAIPTT